MVCREYRVSSVFIAQVRTASIFDDAQIQSLYHTALHDPVPVGGGEGWSRSMLFQHVIARARADVDNNPLYRPQRRAGLRARLESAVVDEADRMGVDRLSALARLQQTVEASQQQFLGRVREIAGRTGMSEREMLAEFHRLRGEAPQGRQARATREELVDLGLIPSDPRTRYALGRLEAMPPRRTPVRLVNRWTPVEPGTSDDSSNLIVEVGTSDLSNRIEVRRCDGSVAAYSGRGSEAQVHALQLVADQRHPTQGRCWR